MEKYKRKHNLVRQEQFIYKYDVDKHELEAKYGLPADVMFCKKCVISNQRPNSAVEFKNKKTSKKETINFDNDSVCDAFNVAEAKKETVDWKQRDKQLKEFCDKYRKNDGSYDCLAPDSGGKDSFYQSHILINAVVKKDNITGYQFHPEKSGPLGLKILKQFVL